MILFTKPGCDKCDRLKAKVDLAALGVREVVLTPDDHKALSEAAFYEVTELAEKGLPILVRAGEEPVSGLIPIKRVLAGKDGA